MRSFQQLVVFFFALFAFAMAQEDTASYDATVYITSTVYRVNTITKSGTAPTGIAANSTATISATHAPNYNGTVQGFPTGTGSTTNTATLPDFTGAASQLNVNAAVAMLAAVGYLVL